MENGVRSAWRKFLTKIYVKCSEENKKVVGPFLQEFFKIFAKAQLVSIAPLVSKPDNSIVFGMPDFIFYVLLPNFDNTARKEYFQKEYDKALKLCNKTLALIQNPTFRKKAHPGIVLEKLKEWALLNDKLTYLKENLDA